jgi:hypothetical protein
MVRTFTFVGAGAPLSASWTPDDDIVVYAISSNCNAMVSTNPSLTVADVWVAPAGTSQQNDSIIISQSYIFTGFSEFYPAKIPIFVATDTIGMGSGAYVQLFYRLSSALVS